MFSQSSYQTICMQDSPIYRFGSFRLDRKRHVLSLKNETIPLADKPFETLLVLVEREGQVVTKDELIKLVWQDSFVEEANISQNIFLLRKMLGKAKDGRQYIETVARHGYRFVCKVRAEEDRGKKLGISRHRGGSIRSKGKQSGESGNGVICSLAILPLTYATADRSLEPVSDDITESVINTLSQLPYLRVVARAIVFRYRRQKFGIQAVANELGVEAILTGKIFALDDIFGVQIELINVADESQFWGKRYMLKTTDIPRVQKEISEEVSSQLKLRSTRKTQSRPSRPTDDVEAYQLYLKGCYHQSKLTEQGLKKGIGYFEKALAKEPSSALAYAGLAECYALGGIPFDPDAALAYAELVEDYSLVAPAPRDAMSKAKSAALKALELDDTLAETHASLGFIRYVLDWDWSAAEKEYRRAIELQPNYAKAHHWLGMCLRTMGRLDGALEEARLALELDPFMLITNVELGRIFYFSRYYDQAIEHYRNALDLESTFLPAHFRLGEAYTQKGMYDEAIAEFHRSVPLIGDDPESAAALAYIYALSGRTDEARRILKNLKELSLKGYVSSYDVAIIYLGLGDQDSALDWLQNAYADHSVRLIGIKVEPMLDSLRADPRFTELMRRVGFAP
jgi:DNA-binding winged helix-turn-helix (wHTH) protein/tetratricopeptide (TPR) repeat protein